MDVLAPISKIMSKDLITVNEKDKLSVVKEIFDKHNIHHIPVVRFRSIIGIISKTDYLFFVRGFTNNEEDRFVNESRLRAYTAEEIMTTEMVMVLPTDRIDVALEIFTINRFHAIPVVENDNLVGIVTTHDIIRALAEERLCE